MGVNFIRGQSRGSLRRQRSRKSGRGFGRQGEGKEGKIGSQKRGLIGISRGIQNPIKDADLETQAGKEGPEK